MHHDFWSRLRWLLFGFKGGLGKRDQGRGQVGKVEGHVVCRVEEEGRFGKEVCMHPRAQKIAKSGDVGKSDYTTGLKPSEGMVTNNFRYIIDEFRSLVPSQISQCPLSLILCPFHSPQVPPIL